MFLARNRGGVGATIGNLKITVDPLLPILVIGLAVAFSMQYYPRTMSLSNPLHYWAYGISTSLLLTFSIFFHEMGHALAAMKRNLSIKRIHLYLFGGMAELKQRPLSALDDFLVSISGPLASLFLASCGIGLAHLVGEYHQPLALLISYVSYMNLLLGIFNLIPIYPLDGGRVLRAFLWWRKNSFYQASIKTYQWGARLIAVLFLAALMSYFLKKPEFTLWFSLSSIYLSYTVLQGKGELMQVPKSDQLVYFLPNNSTVSNIYELALSHNINLNDVWFPVLAEGRLYFVMDGEHLKDNKQNFGELVDKMQEPNLGKYIDTKKATTFGPKVRFDKEIVPIFEEEIFIGMGDSKEVQFWLLQGFSIKNLDDSERITL